MFVCLLGMCICICLMLQICLMLSVFVSVFRFKVGVAYAGEFFVCLFSKYWRGGGHQKNTRKVFSDRFAWFDFPKETRMNTVNTSLSVAS